MQRNLVEELYRELDATDEAYVRNKLATNGYPTSKIKHVRTWIERKDAEAKARHDASVRFWTMIAGVGTLGTVVVAALGMIRN
ncbi:hypothetical protein [Roseateles sp. P5_E4]